MIRFKVLPIGHRDFNAVKEVLASKSLGMGKTVARLEEEFADYVGSQYAVALNSCTNSLYLSLCYCRFPYNSVRIPSMMVPLVANEIIHAEYTPYFVDNVEWIGSSYSLENTPIIDSAHEVISLNKEAFDNRIICYSFYPTKPVCGADGGMICTNEKEWAEWFRKARYFGFGGAGTICKNSWEYEPEFIGWKMNMTDVQAAIALTQLRNLPKNHKRMEQIRRLYNAELGYNRTSHYLYRINVKKRDRFIEYMANNGIECGVHYKPLHMMKPYQKYPRDDMSKTEAEYKTTVSLPYHTSLSDEDVWYIVEKIKDWN